MRILLSIVALLLVAVGVWFWRTHGEARAVVELAPPVSHAIPEESPNAELSAASQPVARAAPLVESAPDPTAKLPAPTSPPAAPADHGIATVRGRCVTPEGAPLVGMQAIVIERFAGSPRVMVDTAADGRFELRFRLRENARSTPPVRVTGPGRAQRELPLRVAPGATEDLGDIALAPLGSVLMRVVDEAGAPIDEVDLRLSRGSGAEPDERARTDGPPEESVFDPRSWPVSLGGGLLRIDGIELAATRAWAHVDTRLWAWSAPLELTRGVVTDAGTLVLVPRPPGTVFAIHVVAADGARLTSEELWISYATTPVNKSGSGTIDGDGRWTLDVAAGSVVSLTMGKHGQAHGPFEWNDLKPTAQEIELVLPVAPSVPVLVHDASGAPIETFDLHVWAGPGDYGAEFGESLRETKYTSHPGGASTVHWPPNVAELKIEAPGYAPHKRAVGGGEAPQRIDVQLDAAGGLRGVVRHAGKPVAGAKVDLVKAVANSEGVWVYGMLTEWEPDVARTAVSDADGAFALVVPESASWYVRVTSPGLAPAELGPWNVDAKGLAEPIAVELGAGGSIEGRVLAATAGQQAGVAVVIANGTALTQIAISDQEGRFRFDRLAPGAWRVQRGGPGLTAGSFPGASGTISRGGMRDLQRGLGKNCVVREAEVTAFDLDLRLAPRIEGRLLLGGRAPSPPVLMTLWAIDGAPRELTHATSPTGPDGAFRVEGDVPGRYNLRVLPAGGKGILVSADLDLTAGLNTWSWSPDLGGARGCVPESLRVGERFWSLHGPAIDGATWSLPVKLDAAGEFSADGIPVGRCDLHWREFPSGNGIAATVDVRAGKTATFELQ